MSRCALLLVSGLMMLCATASNADVQLLAQAPRISKPKPAPSTPPQVPPLPPAVFDPTLAVGGENVKAREIDTRLSVDVL